VAERRMARERLPDGQFFEIFVDTPLAVASMS
jgi:adenylylsulfate kinase-like enzyme